MRFRRAWLGICVLGLGCGGMVAARRVQPVLLATPQAPPMVRGAIVRALAANQYQAEADEAGRIVARYDRRGTMYRIEIAYSPTQYSIRYLDSQGVDLERDEETGELMITRSYARWIKRLGRSIDQELGRPVREQRAALAAARQHELALVRSAEERERLRLAAEQEAHRPVVVQQQPAPVFNVVPQLVNPGIQLGGGVDVQHNVQHSEQSLTCCINGAYYACPGQQAFQNCMSLGPSECTRDTSRDSQCL